MAAFGEVLAILTGIFYIALGTISFRSWKSERSATAFWAMCVFVSLALVSFGNFLIGAFENWNADLVIRSTVAVVVTLPYSVFNFAGSFAPFGRRLNRVALGSTLLVLTALLFVGELSASTGQATSGFATFSILFLVHWTAFSAIAIARLWRMGKQEPRIARRRMRMMSVAVGALAVAMLLAFGVKGELPSILVGILGTLSGITFYLGFAPPQFLRQSWRRGEQERLNHELQTLMKASSVQDVSDGLLPYAVSLVGARRVALVDLENNVLGTFGQLHTAAKEESSDIPAQSEGVPHRITVGEDVTLLVWTSPYTPYFGRAEFDLLETVASLANVALRRIGASAREENTLAALELANAELRMTNDRLNEEIVERQEAEIALHEARHEAELANRSKSEFLSRMSHELRTPLNSILGFGQLLQMDDLDEDTGDNVHQILKAGEHLLSLINEVLDISRIEAGSMTLSLEGVAVADAILEVIDLMGPLASERRVELSYDTATYDSTYVRADQQRLKQVLINLIGNAVKYNREDGRVHVSMDSGAPGILKLCVEDTGIGIRPELRDRLFTPFERLGSENGPVEGTGLGLALSKSLVELMGGSIGAESSPDGSTFWVELPTTEAPSSVEIERGSDTLTTPTLGSIRVLYIEDNLANLKLIERILSMRPGVSMIPAMQAAVGIELAREHSPDLILLDLHLPDMPGEEALQRLRSDRRTREIPIVVVSADATPGQIERLLGAGANDYLTKPLSVAHFLKVFDDALVIEEAS